TRLLISRTSPSFSSCRRRYSGWLLMYVLPPRSVATYPWRLRVIATATLGLNHPLRRTRLEGALPISDVCLSSLYIVSAVGPSTTRRTPTSSDSADGWPAEPRAIVAWCSRSVRRADSASFFL